MFIKFNVHKIVSLYEQGLLDFNFIDPEGQKHFDKWKCLSDTLLRVVEYRRTNKLVGNRLGYSFIDRSKAMPSLVKTHIDETQLIPIGKPQSLNVLDICLDRADEILKINKHINVLWSGGIDSTLALFSLLHQSKNKDQLSILCTFDSILESGGLFDSVIKNLGIRIKFDQTRNNTNSSYTYDFEDPSQLYITGQCADQMFGGPGFLKFSNQDTLAPWYTADYDQKLFDLIEPSIKYSERPIETVRDFRWWVAFNFGWLSPYHDDHIDRPLHLIKRISSFYATPEFQRWAIHTPSYYENPISFDVLSNYKFAFKQALRSLLNYHSYIDNKGKGIGTSWIKNKSWYLVDKNFKTYYINN